MDWSIQEIAKLAGTTSRTLRHYDDVNLLTPSRIGPNGYRYYDEAALVRLQRILLLRELGLGLTAISEALENTTDATQALRNHLLWLRQEQNRIAQQIASVEETIDKSEKGEQLMAQDMFNGFDHTQYKDEVEQRWGKDAYAAGDAWWHGMTAVEKQTWKEHTAQLNTDWTSAAKSSVAPDSPHAQVLAERHFDWLAAIPGTPGGTANGPSREYFLGLADMYVADPRFGANYGGQSGAEFVRDAMTFYAERNL